MLTKDNVKRFHAIARDLYTKEYLGVDEYGKNREYEDELTSVFARYLISVFHDKSAISETKQELRDVMQKHEPANQSNILKIFM